MRAALFIAAATVGGVGAFCPGVAPLFGRAPSRTCQSRNVRVPVVHLRAAVDKLVDGVAGTDELMDRQNAHVVGLLQNPFDESGSSGAFPGMPEHMGRITEKPIAPNTPQLTPWGETAAFPERCPEDPFAIVREELSPFSDSIKDVVTTDHPILSEAAKHFFAERQVHPPPSSTTRPTLLALSWRMATKHPQGNLSAMPSHRSSQTLPFSNKIRRPSTIHIQNFRTLEAA